MPRRIGKEADKIAAQGALARINLVIRNGRFQKELVEAKDQAAIAMVAERWGLVRIPVITRDTHLGKLIEERDLKTLLNEMPGYIPKIELLRAYLFKAIDAPSGDSGPQYREMMELKIDLTYPLDVLEESFRSEVKKAKRERDQLAASAGLTLPHRVRLDKSDFQLKVYDLVMERKRFRDIAGILGRPVSTVKSACVESTRRIYSVRPIGEELTSQHGEIILPAKKKLPIVGFDPSEHISQCPICKRANLPKDFCSQARAYAEQDYVSQDEFPMISEELEAPLHKTGRKLPKKSAE